MSVWTEPSPSDFDRWEARIAAGEDFVDAANAEGHSSSAFRRADRKRHEQIKTLWHEVQGIEDRTTARTTLREIATDTNVDPSVRVRASELVGKSSGYLGDKVAVELAGPEGGAIVVAHERRLTLADVADFDRTLNGPGGGTVGELPVARPVAEPPPG